MADTTFAKWFEGQVHTEGQELQRRKPVFWHRFPDAFAARSALPPQPGDFMLVSRAGSNLIEVKTSEVHESLRNCAAGLIDQDQVGHHLLWKRARQKSYFIFMSDLNDNMEVWDGALTVEHRANSAKLRVSALRRVLPYSSDNLRDLLHTISKGEM